ncbi:amidase signature domain-containing protein [Bombardia bombarda]|uniref:Amidase signature domain-containing protein n=1 Tax=Bombardia bombarda TaxID=252184 RepID=A0AA39W3W7_9PEZI|nr:amidase signature domain-containing protein [Bombardia bombarda]
MSEAEIITIHVVHLPTEAFHLSQGPYFLYTGRLHHVYRLYPDTAGAFVVATVPADNNGTFRSLDASAYGEEYPSTLTIAVPSRLYFTPTKAKPYAGLRLAIKDIIDLKGLKTGGSSRAYTALYGPRTTSAETVQRLVDLGFVIVGKVKTTQFADSEWPTSDWVDYHAPFNPRGDGYLTTSGSSAGSAAAVAAYDWLDFSLGTDTREFAVLAEALYGPSSATDIASNALPHQKPTVILYPIDYWPAKDTASQEVFEAFIARLERFLGVTRTEISLEDTWAEHRPEGVTESLSEYFEHIFEWAANPDQWTGLFRDFLSDYESKFGKPPVLNPQLRFKVGYLPTVTPEQQAEAVRRMGVYQDWFYTHVMPPVDENQGHSKTVMVLPWTNGVPDYRDTYRDGPQHFTGIGFFFYNVGPYAEAPELVIPVGTTPYVSKFTGKTERLPAAVGVVGAKGGDVALARLGSAPQSSRLSLRNTVNLIWQATDNAGYAYFYVDI